MEMPCNGESQAIVGDKFVQYSAVQVMVLEQVFVECQKPSHAMRVAMIRENSVLSNLNSQEIQIWFEYRRFLEKKKKDAFVILLNEKIAAIGRLRLLQNDYLHAKVQHLLREKEYMDKLLQCASPESFLALEIPRSVFKNVKMGTRRRLLLLQNEYLQMEAQQLQREREYIQNLLGIQSSIESMVNSYRSWSRAADSSKGLRLLSRTTAKFTPKKPSELNCVYIPRMKFFGGLKEIFVNTCLDLTHFSVNGITIDVSAMLSFVKAAMKPDGALIFLCKHQEFIICCSVKDIKLALQGSQESLTTIVPAFLPQGFRVAVGCYCVIGAWSYFPNEQATPGNFKVIVRFKCVN